MANDGAHRSSPIKWSLSFAVAAVPAFARPLPVRRRQGPQSPPGPSGAVKAQPRQRPSGAVRGSGSCRVGGLVRRRERQRRLRWLFPAGQAAQRPAGRGWSWRLASGARPGASRRTVEGVAAAHRAGRARVAGGIEDERPGSCRPLRKVTDRTDGTGFVGFVRSAPWVCAGLKPRFQPFERAHRRPPSLGLTW